MEKPSDKVNWIRTHKCDDGTEFSVSERTGIVKVLVPGVTNRPLMAYADEFLQFMGVFAALQRYLEQNDDVAISRDQSKDIRKIKKGQERTLYKATEALSALSPEQLAAIVGQLAKQKQA